MDARTTELYDALQHPGAAFLLELLSAPATEAKLLAAVKRTTQATGNRRLAALEHVGLIAREQGNTQAPGRRWAVQNAAEVEQVIQAGLALSTAVGRRQEAELRAAERKLKRARAARLGIRDASGRERPLDSRATCTAPK